MSPMREYPTEQPTNWELKAQMVRLGAEMAAVRAAVEELVRGLERMAAR